MAADNFPKVIMQWKEPLAFSTVQRTFEPRRNYWPWIIAFSLIYFLIFGYWLVMLFAFNRLVVPHWLIVMLFIHMLLMIYIQYLVNTRVPVNVIVWNRWISRYSWGTPQTPEYADINEYQIVETSEYHILELTTFKGQTVMMGMPLDVDRSKLEKILQEKGIVMKTSIAPQD